MTKQDIIKILADRDQMSLSDAADTIEAALEDVNAAMEEGNLSEAEEAWLYGTGLEICYLIDVLL